MKNAQELEMLCPAPSVEMLENYAARMKKVIGYKKIALSRTVPGSLRISRNHGCVQFYHVTEKGDSNGKYISRKNEKLVRQLAQKGYDRHVLKRMIALEKEIQRFCKKYKALRLESVFWKMLEERKSMVKPIILVNDEYASLWRSEEFKGKLFWDGDKEYFAANGLRVRSKSEILIADTLLRYEIPFRYEFPVELRRFGTVHPDFYVLRVADRKEFCWEHFGMMDDPDYAEMAVRKLASYAENGWIPGENLIVTFETSSHPLEEKQIERLVEKIFV